MNAKLAVAIAARIIARWEGLRLRPYLCPAGVPTIGYGSTYYRNGIRVRLQDAAITREEATALLLWMIETVYLPAVLRQCPDIDTPERIAAITDFCYNLGENALKISTLRKRINAGRWIEVPDQLRKWNKAGGVVLPGLTARREAEAALIAAPAG